MWEYLLIPVILAVVALMVYMGEYARKKLSPKQNALASIAWLLLSTTLLIAFANVGSLTRYQIIIIGVGFITVLLWNLYKYQKVRRKDNKS